MHIAQIKLEKRRTEKGGRRVEVEIIGSEIKGGQRVRVE